MQGSPTSGGLTRACTNCSGQKKQWASNPRGNLPHEEATWETEMVSAIRPVLLKGKGHGVRDCLVANGATRMGNLT